MGGMEKGEVGSERFFVIHFLGLGGAGFDEVDISERVSDESCEERGELRGSDDVRTNLTPPLKYLVRSLT